MVAVEIEVAGELVEARTTFFSTAAVSSQRSTWRMKKVGSISLLEDTVSACRLETLSKSAHSGPTSRPVLVFMMTTLMHGGGVIGRRSWAKSALSGL